MSELSIRRELNLAQRFEKLSKSEKAAAPAQAQSSSAAQRTNQSADLSADLQRLVMRRSIPAEQVQDARRQLQTGEGALAETRDTLKQMIDLAQQAGGGGANQTRLQRALDQLNAQISNLLQSASLSGSNPADRGAGLQTMLQDLLSGGEGEASATPEAMLSQLGLDASATPEELLTALASQSGSEAADALTLLYLGAVIAGAGTGADVNLPEALDGLRQLLEQAASGENINGTIQNLTNGRFETLMDALNSTALLEGADTADLTDFLTALLLGEGSALAGDNALLAALLDDAGGLPLDLLLGSLSELQAPEVSQLTSALPSEETAQTLQFGQLQLSGSDLSGVRFDEKTGALLLDGAGRITLSVAQNPTKYAANAQNSPGNPAGAPISDPNGANGVMSEWGPPHGVALPAAPEASPAALASVPTSQAAPTAGENSQAAEQTRAQSGAQSDALNTPSQVLIQGRGDVTFRNVAVQTVTVLTQDATLTTQGQSQIHALQLAPGGSLTLAGPGALDLGAVTVSSHSAKGDGTLNVENALVSVDGGGGNLPANLSVNLSNSSAILAANLPQNTQQSQTFEPFDLVWKAMLPGWTQINALTVDGQTLRLPLWNSGAADTAARLWLEKNASNPNQGHPIHRVTIEGRENADQSEIQTVWLQWNERQGRFEQVSMYPNPFIIIGGEKGADWTYEEATQTLRILTPAVTAVSGGPGTDAEQNAFSGRLAIRDNLGTLDLTLDNVTCQVEEGQAFNLGRENTVCLHLAPGTDSHFQSGPGRAGITIGDGTSAEIGAPPPVSEDDDREEDEIIESSHDMVTPGSLTAVGGEGGAGLGRDTGNSVDRISALKILGGMITAKGTGGGTGIGAGKYAYFGDILISGGEVDAAGGPGGGAGIGAGLGAPAGNITITGGVVSAFAAYHAAAIGAGVEGECGNVTIRHPACVKKAQGADPGLDIGAARFAPAGSVEVDPGTVPTGTGIGGAEAELWVKAASPAPAAREESAAPYIPQADLPRFVITPRMLRLKNFDLSTVTGARAASQNILAADRRLERVRRAYEAMCARETFDQAEQRQRPRSVPKLLIRTPTAAAPLLDSTKQNLLNIPLQAMCAHNDQDSEDVMKLLG